MAAILNGQPMLLIFDEFPYAVESDAALPSHLQAAWDHLFKTQPITLVLSGSHIGMMVDLFQYQAPFVWPLYRTIAYRSSTLCRVN